VERRTFTVAPPWTVTVEQAIVVDTDMLDAMCLENEKDVPHLR
jgi:hypothetical protein